MNELEELLIQFMRDKKEQLKKGYHDTEEFSASTIMNDYGDWIHELVDNFIADEDWDEWEKELKEVAGHFEE